MLSPAPHFLLSLSSPSLIPPPFPPHTLNNIVANLLMLFVNSIRRRVFRRVQEAIEQRRISATTAKEHLSRRLRSLHSCFIRGISYIGLKRLCLSPGANSPAVIAVSHQRRGQSFNDGVAGFLDLGTHRSCP